jgi:hypothetical protein
MAALRLARAGDYRQAAPEAAAHAASGAEVAVLFAGFVAAGGLGSLSPSVQPSRALAVSP